jgi:hypothetical protein
MIGAAWRSRLGMHGVTPMALMVFQCVGAMSGNPITVKLFWLSMAYAVAAAVPIVRGASQRPVPAPAPVSVPLVSA